MRALRWSLLWGLAVGLSVLVPVQALRYEPVWLLLPQDVAPLVGAGGHGTWPQCFLFNAWLTNTGPVTLVPLHLGVEGDVVKRGRDGTWVPLHASDIVRGQSVAVCLCGEVFVFVHNTVDGPFTHPCPGQLARER